MYNYYTFLHIYYTIKLPINTKKLGDLRLRASLNLIIFLQ